MAITTNVTHFHCLQCPITGFFLAFGPEWELDIRISASNIFGDAANISGGVNINLPAGVSLEQVPLPAALPLFATILAGSGLIAWRRKRKAIATPAG